MDTVDQVDACPLSPRRPLCPQRGRGGFQPKRGPRASYLNMDIQAWVAIVASFVVIAGLISYGFTLFADYHASGRWAKNATGLLAAVGMLALALAMILTPRNAMVILQVAQTGASRVFLVISSGLLLAAIGAFGIINYWKPLRLWHERRIGKALRGELPKIP